MNDREADHGRRIGNIIDLNRLFAYRREHRMDMTEKIPWERSLLMYQKKFGKTLQFLREQRGWSREELAEKLGVSPVMVWRYETGENFAEMALMIRIAYDIFRVGLDELIGAKPLTIAKIEPLPPAELPQSGEKSK